MKKDFFKFDKNSKVRLLPSNNPYDKGLTIRIWNTIHPILDATKDLLLAFISKPHSN